MEITVVQVEHGVQFNEKYFATLFAKISQLLQQLEKQAQVQTDEFHLLPLHILPRYSSY